MQDAAWEAWNKVGLLKMLFVVISRGFYKIVDAALPDVRLSIPEKYAEATSKFRGRFKFYLTKSYSRSLWSMLVEKYKKRLIRTLTWCAAGCPRWARAWCRPSICRSAATALPP